MVAVAPRSNWQQTALCGTFGHYGADRYRARTRHRTLGHGHNSGWVQSGGRRTIWHCGFRVRWCEPCDHGWGRWLFKTAGHRTIDASSTSHGARQLRPIIEQRCQVHARWAALTPGSESHARWRALAALSGTRPENKAVGCKQDMAAPCVRLRRAAEAGKNGGSANTQ